MADMPVVGSSEFSPLCVGAGFVALDVVIGHEAEAPIRLWAGGSCGNVMTILAYLGWKAHPAARLGHDATAQELVADLARWGVHTQFLLRETDGRTPMIVERLRLDEGQARHTFEWTCPCCGNWLPRYKPLRLTDTAAIRECVTDCAVFYFDRVAPSSVQLAKHFKEQGSVIVFEPSSIRDPKLFEAALATADVVKYSNERLGDAEELAKCGSAILQVETLGKEGLRYRYGRKSRWWHVPSFPVTSVRDTVGSGDWCTAGFIHMLGKGGREPFLATERAEMELALRYGQALAAINCFYEGARGAMYSLEKSQHFAMVQRLWMSGVADQPLPSGEATNTEMLRGLCPSCEETDVVRRLVGGATRAGELSESSTSV